MTEAKRADVGDVGPLLNVGLGKPDIDSTARIAKQVRAQQRIRGTCRECGKMFIARRAKRDFSSKKCRRDFHNRRMTRGAELYDVLMSLRFARAQAKAEGVWSLLCRMAASYKASDDREGRRSWDDIRKVKQRNAALASTVVGLDADGMGRRR